MLIRSIGNRIQRCDAKRSCASWHIFSHCVVLWCGARVCLRAREYAWLAYYRETANISIHSSQMQMNLGAFKLGCTHLRVLLAPCRFLCNCGIQKCFWRSDCRMHSSLCVTILHVKSWALRSCMMLSICAFKPLLLRHWHKTYFASTIEVICDSCWYAGFLSAAFQWNFKGKIEYSSETFSNQLI